MDILRFVNSKDIRTHLHNINYRFDSLEAAWLIRQCRNATIKEKHAAWEELIRTMPDCHIEERLNTAPQDSLHRFLKIYIALEDKYINEFCNEKSADTYDDCAPFVYRFNYIYKDGSSDDRGTVFSSFDAIQKAINDPEEDVVSIKCTKMRIDEPNSRQIVYLTPKFEILSIDPGHIKDKHDYEIYRGVFDGLWFNFPTPFRKGDIVWDPKAPEGCCCGGPFVTTGVCLDGIVYPEVKDNLKKTEIPRICVPEGIS